MAVKEYQPKKLLYSMGEVAEMFDVNQSLIRFWEQKFDILKPKKNKKGNRMFTPEDVRNFEVIYHLVKERGMTLVGAQKYMKANRREVERDAEIVRHLQNVRSMLVEIREELKEEEGRETPRVAAERTETTPKIELLPEIPVPAVSERTSPADVAVHLEEEEEVADREADEELTPPFTAQRLFGDASPEDLTEIPETGPQTPKPETGTPDILPADTQQSLF